MRELVLVAILLFIITICLIGLNSKENTIKELQQEIVILKNFIMKGED